STVPFEISCLREPNLWFAGNRRSAANLRHVENCHADSRLFDRCHQRTDHLFESYQAATTRARTCRRDALAEPINGRQNIWPPMPRPEDIPGPENRRIHTTGTDETFAFGANFLVHFHDGRRLRDADVDKVFDPALSRGGD